MGLSVSHDCWEGSYSSFHRWRVKLADVVGIPLDLMEGYSQGNLLDSAVILQNDPRYKHIGDALINYLSRPVQWDILKPDILHVLLHHSDCDGYLPVEVLEPLADRLSELLPLLDGDGGGHIGSYRDKTKKFIDGLRLAASLGEQVEFS